MEAVQGKSDGLHRRALAYQIQLWSGQRHNMTALLEIHTRRIQLEIHTLRTQLEMLLTRLIDHLRAIGLGWVVGLCSGNEHLGCY